MKRIIIHILLLAATVGATAQNKAKNADFDTDTLMTHDPVIAFERGVYHLFGTGDALQHATSTDLKHWRVHSQPALSRIPEWTHDSVAGFKHHVWAPDIIRYRGRWWLAYSCSTFGKNTSAIGLASARRLDREPIEWKDHGPIVCSREGRDNWNAIDPNFVIDDKDRPWLVFGSFWDGIQLVRLDKTMHMAKGERPRTIARRHAGGGENPIEAPFIFKRDGWYYLFVSWDFCCRGMESTYKVVVGRSRNVAGPYLDRTGRDMLNGGGTLVIEGDKREFEAAGHSAAYTFGGRDCFVCHGYSIARGGTSVLVTRHMTWDDEGWPSLF